jgi:Double zinc ribbon
MRCSTCQQELPAQARFCSECGTSVVATSAVNVKQAVGTVDGTVTGVSAGNANLPAGMQLHTDQKIETVAAGGTVVGTVLGGSGSTTIGGQHVHGDQVHGDKVQGDKVMGNKSGDSITVGDISGSNGIAIGRGAQAIVNTAQASGDHAELQQLLKQLEALLQQLPATQQSEAEAVAALATQTVQQATSAKPNKTLVQISSEGLKQAAQNLAEVFPTVLKIAALVAKIMP